MSTIAVAVGLLRGANGHLLLCQRSSTGRYPNKWEFPGGKVEPTESPEVALVRELREELAIEAEIGPLYHAQHAGYADGGAYDVYYFLVESWIGEPSNQVFADIRWVPAGNLTDYDILEGNREICRRLAADANAITNAHE